MEQKYTDIIEEYLILQENLGRIPRPFNKSIPKAIVDKPLRPETDLGKLTRQMQQATKDEYVKDANVYADESIKNLIKIVKSI